MHKITALYLLSTLCLVSLGSVSTSLAVAPPREGQPYAESICDTDPNVIFCEDYTAPL